MDAKLEALASVPLFSGLKKKHLEAIGRVTDRVNVDVGTTLIRQDQVTTHMSILISGLAEVTVDGNHVADAGPGEVVGEFSMVDGDRASATVTITEAAELWHIARAGFIPVWEDNPDMSHPMLLTVIAKLRETNALLYG